MESNTEPGTNKILRVLLGVGSVLPAGFTFLLVRTNIDDPAFDWRFVAIASLPLTMAVLGWWFAFFGHHASHRARMKFALTGGVVLGAIGLLGGFVGPLLFAPEANQGPLLGIAITGPIGFQAGFWLSVLYGFFKGRRSNAN